MKKLWTNLDCGSFHAKNRLIRSATFEGLGDHKGNPLPALADMYSKLASNKVGTIITGFCFISEDGRAMHQGQCGIESDSRIESWRAITSAVQTTNADTNLVMQIAHTGRQTISKITDSRPIAPSALKSKYFRCKPREMSDHDIEITITAFAQAVQRAFKAGFNGVQLHAAHGYLIHQFLSPALNKRKDCWGKDRLLFLKHIIIKAKELCGDNLPLIVKISAGDDDSDGMNPSLVADYLSELQEMGICAAEISYGTMENALNIFRGSIPINHVLTHNPFFNCYNPIVKKLWKKFAFPLWKKRLIPFTENYNLETCREISKSTTMPLFLVGGIRNLKAMEDILSEGIEGISLCRPFIHEPEFGTKLFNETTMASSCTNCNICSVMCDSCSLTRCYKKNGGE